MTDALLTSTVREPGEDDWEYQLRAKKVEERAEWKLIWSGTALAAFIQK